MGSIPPPSEGRPEFQPGDAGGSLDREYRRRKQARERRVREEHPHLGGVLLRLNPEPQHQPAFQIGARGERTVAGSIERCIAETGTAALHNRRMPGGRRDIDHIVIAPSGVYVIDTKAVRGKVQIQRPWFGQPKLMIAGRDRTRYADGLERQVSAVRQAAGDALAEDTPVQGILCFTEADLPFLRTQKFHGHLLMYQRPLRKRLQRPGPLSGTAISEIAERLSKRLPRA